ncbi:MAG: hypothetical protein QNK37_11895 [Acidobacteriota bacterium]|nr:hypothetical protein [Acidobacteriota bacterium]
MPFRFYDINWTFHTLFTAFFLVSGVLFLYLGYKRRRDFSFVTGRLGLRFLGDADESLRPLLEGFPLFPCKEPMCASQVITGIFHGIPLTAFNYGYRDGPTFEDMHLYQCVVFQLAAPLPSLVMIPSPPKPDVLATDCIFWEDERFSSLYAVHGDDTAFAHQLIDESSARRLGANPGFRLMIEADRLLIARSGEFEAASFRAFIEDALPTALRARDLASARV